MKRMRVGLGLVWSHGLAWLGGLVGTYPGGDGGCGCEEEDECGDLHRDDLGGLDVEGFGDVQVVRGAGNREDALFLSTSNESILAMSVSYCLVPGLM